MKTNYLLKKICSFLIVCTLIFSAFVTVINVNAATNSFTVEFKSTAGGDSSSEISKDKKISDITTSGGEYLSSIKSTTATYLGKNGYGIKIGKSGAPGSITFALNKSYNVKSITVFAKKYGSDTGKLIINGNTIINTALTEDGVNCKYTYNTATDLSEITLATSSKRAYVLSMTVECESVTTPSVDLEGPETVYLDDTSTFSYTATPENINNPSVPTFTSSNTDVATISTDGILTPIKVGTTNIQAEISGTKSNTIEVKVLPKKEKTLTIAEAKTVCGLVGSTATECIYTVKGIVTKIVTEYSDQFNNITVNIQDGNGDELQCFRLTGGQNLAVGNSIVVTGKLKKYSGTNEFDAGATYDVDEGPTLAIVSFDLNGGEGTCDAQIVKIGSKITKPADDPTRNGAEFAGWYKESTCENAWIFATDTVSANTTLFAKWNVTNKYAAFEALKTVANMRFDYEKESNFSIESSFICTKKESKEVPTGWKTNIAKGSYDDPFWQSFRNNDEYVQYDNIETRGTKFNISIICYLNNTGDTKNKSSIISFEGLKADGTVVDSWKTENINGWTTGVANAQTINCVLEGVGIKSIKVSLVKDGGGNVGFSNISIDTGYSYSINKVEEKNQVYAQFAGLINASVKEELDSFGDNVTYGVAYALESKVSSIDKNNINNENVHKVTYNKDELTGVDSTGLVEKATDPDKFVWGVSIDNISEQNYNDKIYAVAYVCVDGEYHFMEGKVHSVVTLANAYVKASDTSSYTKHLGVLNWLASKAE